MLSHFKYFVSKSVKLFSTYHARFTRFMYGWVHFKHLLEILKSFVQLIRVFVKLSSPQQSTDIGGIQFDGWAKRKRVVTIPKIWGKTSVFWSQKQLTSWLMKQNVANQQISKYCLQKESKKFKNKHALLHINILKKTTLHGTYRSTAVRRTSLSAAAGFSMKITRYQKKLTTSEKKSLDLNFLRWNSLFCLKWFSCLLYCPKTFTSLATLVKQIMLKPRKSHTNNLQAFLMSRKQHHWQAYFRAINVTFHYFRCSVPAKKWIYRSVLASNAATNTTEVKTARKRGN